ncbi:hypothetical protein FSP39_020873 [Pinctada imbricata]|uniref:Deacetylase sirtuin-type domain-containing protein n=1 Tax=Pinctada imbricata TaxID=66713 RepID=A0AA88Y7S8_PINIB|nr:hypothetical protein FSP39_020873 [Pinctada imbricata]
MAGAGISTSAGIPDFRSPGTGLYDNLQKYNLPNPQAIFSLDYFQENPEPFFILAKELYPGVFKNIDTLEAVAGLSPERMVEAHGSFRTGHCLKCKKEFTQEWMKDEIFADRVPKCTLAECEGVVKPDIVFFGEALPERFRECVQSDFSDCDLLIILGTSLIVQPFASLTARLVYK